MVKGCVTQQVTVFLHEMRQVVMSCQEVCCLHQHWFFTHDADDVTCEHSQIRCQNKKCIQNFHNLPFTSFFFSFSSLRYKSFGCTYFKEVWTIKEMCHNQSIPAYFLSPYHHDTATGNELIRKMNHKTKLKIWNLVSKLKNKNVSNVGETINSWGNLDLSNLNKQTNKQKTCMEYLLFSLFGALHFLLP